MPCKKFSTVSTFVLAIFTLAMFATSASVFAQEERVLHSFNPSGKGGYAPNAGLIIDAAGNLYGVTNYGGAGDCTSAAGAGCGTVFELSPGAHGAWIEKVLHSFSNNGTDGYYPAAGLILDSAGNLYGTTAYGGSGVCSNAAPLSGCGTVFELSPLAGGGWAERVLHSFGGGADGELPLGGLILDGAGHLYGTTAGITAPPADYGTVFELTPHAGKPWTEKVLHNFSDNGTDGYAPHGSLVLDPAANLYGVTYSGGANGDGTVFELTSPQGGSRTEKVLYSFENVRGSGAAGPEGLVRDVAGNLYGTTSLGGETNWGTVFELTPEQGGSWTATILYMFNAGPAYGGAPTPGLTIDAGGNLYGTNQLGGAGQAVCLTFAGGSSVSCGTVFQLTRTAGGGWTQTTLHSFGNGTDGQAPYAGLIRDAGGNFYGTTYGGGAGNGGTVFELKP